MLDTAVIPCGGRGSRLHPITRWLPKEILPVGLRPILHWVLDEAAEAGILRAVIVTNPHKPILETVARSYAGPLELEFVPQPHPRGLGDAFLRAADHLGDAPFLALLPDNLFLEANPSAAVLTTFHASGLATVLLAQISRLASGTYGPTGRATVSLAADGSLRVVNIADKGVGQFDTGGEPSALTPVGRVAFPAGILSEFKQLGRDLGPARELDDVPMLQRLAARHELAGVTSAARFFDVGRPEGYRDAVGAVPGIA